VAAPPPPSDKRLFTGKERDSETGMDYFGARYLRAANGRFTTTDPVVTLDENFADPQRWNRYAYVRNNPLRWTDPDGRCIDGCVIEAGLAAMIVYTAATQMSAYLQSPQGREQIRAIGVSTGQMVTTAVGAIRSWFQADNSRGEPPQLKEGKEAHKKEEVRPGEKAEVPTPSGNGRMDRYDADKAHIREIKPDNSRGERSGQKQLDRYRKEMEDATGRPHTTELTKWRKEY
jgi:RHS repeat-associated protein